MFFMVFSMNPWPKPVYERSDNCPDHFGPVWTSPDHSQPIFQLLPIFIFLHIFLTPATTLSAPCFLFFEPTSPQDLQLRIKRRELVSKAARISNFIAPAPHWWEIKRKFRQNRDFMELHFFAKKQEINKHAYPPLFSVSWRNQPPGPSDSN